MTKKFLLIPLIAVLVIIITAYILFPIDNTRVDNAALERRRAITNPAADLCESSDHTFAVRSVDGSERGFCVASDGSEQDLWEWYEENK